MTRVQRAQFMLLLQEMEDRARKLGLPITAGAINNAKNAAGWELADDHERAGKAAQGGRP